jgi:predicted AAA+ superfamily ATPase
MRDAFGFTPDQYAWFGGYPGAAPLASDESRFKSYVAGSIVEASLNRDIFLLTRIDKPALLRQVFDLGVAYSGQILSLTKLLGQLADAGNTTTLSRYLRLLDQAGLLAGLSKFSTNPVVSRGSIPKFQVHNMALMTASRTDGFAAVRADGRRWGRVVESAVGAHLLAEVGRHPLARLEYWRDGNDEVDFVVRWGETVIGLEVKSTTGTTRGLATFRHRYPDAKTVIVADDGIPWTDLLATPLPALISALA